LDIISVLFLLLTQRFQVLKSFPQGVLSSKARDTLRRLFSCCVYYTLCKKYGSDTDTIHRSIARCFAYRSKTVSHGILQRRYFHGLSLLVFIQRYFMEFNYRLLFRQVFFNSDLSSDPQVTDDVEIFWRRILYRPTRSEKYCWRPCPSSILLRRKTVCVTTKISDARDKISACATIIEK